MTSYEETKRKEALQHQPFDCEQWYSLLEPENLTFPSQFFTLSIEEAKAIVHFYRYRYIRNKDPFTQDEFQLLRGVQDRIDALLALPDFTEGAFVRLSNRSPKDATYLGDITFQEIFDQEHAKVARMAGALPSPWQPPSRAEVLSQESTEVLPSGLDPPLSPWEVQCLRHREDEDTWAATTRLHSFFRASFRALPARTGVQAMQRLLSSERVYVDLLDALVAPDLWKVYVCVRRWEPRVSEDLEFRCFVHDTTMTAVTQYNHYATYAHLGAPGVAPYLVAKLARFFETRVQPVLRASPRHRDCVCDMAVLQPEPHGGGACDTPLHSALIRAADSWASRGGQSNDPGLDEDGVDVCVIELNPFLPTTGAALFCWNHHRPIFEGREPFEFRYRRFPAPGSGAFLSNYVEGMIARPAEDSTKRPWTGEWDPAFSLTQSEEVSPAPALKRWCTVL